MMNSCVAPHAQKKTKPSKDRIFGASEAAQKRISEIGADAVINATIGCILDNDENFVVLPTVSKVYRSLKDAEYFKYAPIMGLPEYLELVQNACFRQPRPPLPPPEAPGPSIMLSGIMRKPEIPF